MTKELVLRGLGECDWIPSQVEIEEPTFGNYFHIHTI